MAPELTHEDHSLLLEIVRCAGTATSQSELLDAVTGALAEALEADVTGAFEFLPDEGTAILQSGTGWERDDTTELKSPAGEGSLVARVLSSRRAMPIGEQGQDPGISAQLLAGRELPSGCVMRIEGPDRPFGYLCAFSLAPREITSAELETIEAAAGAVALALGRLRAERRLAAQRGLTELVTSTSRITEASSKLLELLGSGIGWDVATLWRADTAANEISCIDAWAGSEQMEPFLAASLERVHAKGDGIPGSVWETATPRWLSEISSEPDFVRAKKAGEAELRTGLFFPIVTQAGVVGILELFTRSVEQPDEALLADLTIFGAQVGQLLEREAMREQLQHSSEELRIVLENLGTAVAAVNPDGSIRFANDAAARSVGLASVQDLLGADPRLLRRRFRVFDEAGAELDGAELNPLREALAGETVGPIITRLLDMEASSERWYQLRTSPLRDLSGEIFCALATVDDVTELKRNEERLRQSEEEHRRIGEVLQRGLMPPAMPELPAVELGVRFRAIEDGALVGGDFYDAFPVSAGKWMLVVGDIAGKGVEAAAFTAFIRYTLRATGVRDRDPAAAFAQLNRMLLDDPVQARLCTAVCVLVDSVRPAKVRVARAGHLPALLLRSGERRPVRVEPAGEVLGGFADARYETEELTLEADDALVLYTDGISDAGLRTQGGALEIEGISERVSAAREEDADGLAGAIDAAAAAADGGDQRDDALVLVVRGR